MHRRLFTTLIAATALAAAAPTAAWATRPFSPTGPWNTPIPANPQLEPTSSAIVAAMSAQISNSNRNGLYPYINTEHYSTPLWAPGPTGLPMTVRNGGTLNTLIAANGGVPFPADAKPADGGDSHITVLDSANHRLYEFWHASTPAQNAQNCTAPLPWGAPCFGDGQWHADWGGIMDQIDTDPGYFSSSSWSGLGSTEGWNWGGTATSLPLVGGLITFEDMRSGVIDHAVAASFIKSCASYFVYPAQRHDDINNDALPTCLPEGAKLQLDPAYDVNANNHPPLTKAIERAAQRYGIIVRDRNYTQFAFYGQDPLTEPAGANPYTTGPGLGGVANGNQGFFGGRKSYELFVNFPWDRLRMIAARHCTSAPCLP